MKTLILVLFALVVRSSWAVVKPAMLFSEGMVLQRDMPMPVWGTADAGEPVTVSIAGQSKLGYADSKGKWRVVLEPLALNARPTELKVSGKESVVVVKDVLVGDVFQCSGQSNMAMSMSAALRQPGTREDIANTDLPTVRVFAVPTGLFAKEPQEDVQGSWVALSPEKNAGMAAVPFYFARALHRHLKIPIGIVRASHGGGAIEIKMSRQALQNTETGRKAYDEGLKHYTPEAIAAREKLFLERWEKSAKEAEALGTTLPIKPKQVPDVDGGYPCADWNQSIAPVIGYAKRGVIWYQGEHNAGNAFEYRKLLPSLIQGWREAYGGARLPFVIVQLPAYGHPSAEGTWPILRESQMLAQRMTPDTALVVTIDHGEKDNIHPADKRDIGERLALETRRLVYGENVTGCGPIFSRHTVEGSRVIVEFNTGGRALKSATGAELQGFLLAGEDRKFVSAKAVIEQGRVVVSSPEVNAPISVRYAWAGFPKASLFDEQGLPAAPFRTDEWPE